MKRILAIFAILLLLPLAAPAADLASLNREGLERLVQQNRGKVIIINFFATWCPPCRKELPELVKLRGAFPESELCLVGLSVDEDSNAVPPFIKTAGVNFPVYLADRDITDTFNITSVPHNIFYNKNGEVVISEPGMAEMGVLKKVVDDLLKSQ